jgi:hypothetical protein
MITLVRKHDQLFACGESGDLTPVRLVYARPISARDQEVSVLHAKKGQELAWLPNLDALDAESRAIAEAELAARYCIAIIENVQESKVNHGHRYLKVDTDRGFRYFHLKEPGKNVTYLTPDHLVIRDSMGNRYEIPSLAALGPESCERLNRVI